MKTETLPGMTGLRVLNTLRSNGVSMSFTELRDRMGMSDGNLASITVKLVRDKLVIKRKRFVGNYPFTTFKLSQKGLETLEAIVKELTRFEGNSEKR